MRFFHGTHVGSASAFASGLALDASVASSQHIDGEPGFYLATLESDAEFFALRRSEGRVVIFDLSSDALESLHAAGAQSRPIPGGRPPYFKGEELFVPTSLFELFNQLAAEGEIVVVR